MSVLFRELADSRRYDLNGRDGSATFHFHAVVAGEADPENAVYAALLADLTIAPFVWNGLARGRPSADPLGNGWYDVKLPYRLAEGAAGRDPGAAAAPGQPPAPPPPPPPTPQTPVGLDVSGEVGGKPPRLYRSRRTTPVNPDGTVGVGAKQVVMGKNEPPKDIVPPNFNRAINVGQDGKVEGVELPEPGFLFTVKRVVPALTWGYLRDRLRECVWKRNEHPFMTFESGAVVYFGCGFSTQKDGQVEMSHRFGVDFDDRGEGGNGIKVRPGNTLLVPVRPAWHYLWARYGPEYDTASGRTVTRAQAAYVEELLDFADFGVLGLGG